MTVEDCSLRLAADVATGGGLRWETLRGSRVQHSEHGYGEISVAARNTLSESCYVLVRWEATGRHTRFDGDGLVELTLLNQRIVSSVVDLAHFQRKRLEQLRKQEQQRLKEAGERVRFDNLKAKYKVEPFSDRSPTSPLFRILLQLDEGEALDQEQLSWLRKARLFELLAAYFQQRFRSSREPWDLVKASSAWRDADRPNKARELMDWLLPRTDIQDARLRSAILTSRGGACRDLGELDAAEKDAQRAVQAASGSFHPYSLLGAICFQRGQAADGEEYFLKAEALGASRRAEDEMEQALRSTDGAERRSVAAYLLQKDPLRYAWAEHYLT